MLKPSLCHIILNYDGSMCYLPPFHCISFLITTEGQEEEEEEEDLAMEFKWLNTASSLLTYTNFYFHRF